MDIKSKAASLYKNENSDQKWLPACAIAAAVCSAGAAVAAKKHAPIAVTAVLMAVAMNCSAYVGQALATRNNS